MRRALLKEASTSLIRMIKSVASYVLCHICTAVTYVSRSTTTEVDWKLIESITRTNNSDEKSDRDRCHIFTAASVTYG